MHLLLQIQPLLHQLCHVHLVRGTIHLLVPHRHLAIFQCRVHLARATIHLIPERVPFLVHRLARFVRENVHPVLGEIVRQCPVLVLVR